MMIMPLLSGCFPAYIPNDIQNTALIDLSELDRANIRTENQTYSLMKDSQGYARIPCGKPIILNHYYSDNLGLVTLECTTSFVFTPRRQQQYFANFLIDEKICTLTIVKKDPKSKTGFSPIEE